MVECRRDDHRLTGRGDEGGSGRDREGDERLQDLLQLQHSWPDDLGGLGDDGSHVVAAIGDRDRRTLRLLGLHDRTGAALALPVAVDRADACAPGVVHRVDGDRGRAQGVGGSACGKDSAAERAEQIEDRAGEEVDGDHCQASSPTASAASAAVVAASVPSYAAAFASAVALIPPSTPDSFSMEARCAACAVAKAATKSPADHPEDRTEQQRSRGGGPETRGLHLHGHGRGYGRELGNTRGIRPQVVHRHPPSRI
nr:hypothetical protein [Rhodococcus koreensis]